VDVEAALDAYGGSYVLRHDPPGQSAPREQGEWYYRNNALVYNALLEAVREIPTLGNSVRRCQPSGNSARMAMATITEFFAHTSELTEDKLTRQLMAMSPTHGESMRSFLSRFDDLAGEYADHGLYAPPSQMVSQVFSHLDLTWRDGMGELGRRSLRNISWREFTESLLLQDERRRASNTRLPGAPQPFGWIPGARGKANAASATEVPPLDQETGTAAPAGAGRPRTRSPGRREGVLICYCCLKAGHAANKCPTRTDEWRYTSEAKEQAEAVKVAMDAKKAKAKEARAKEARATETTAPKAKAAKATFTESSSPPSSPEGSPRVGRPTSVATK
jgi:hypothetical protein